MIGKILTAFLLLAGTASAQIVVSDVPSTGLKLPNVIETMTKSQFEMFARDLNQQAYQRAAMNAEEVEPIKGEVRLDSTTSNLLFPISSTPVLVPSQVAPVTVNEQRVTRRYEVQYRGSAPYGGGPVTIVNPYCFDYWKQHTE